MYLDLLHHAIKQKPSKFQALLYSILALLIFQPFVPDTALREAVVTLIVTSVLISAVYAISDEKKKHIVSSILLAVPAIVMSGLHYFSKDPNILTLSYFLKIFFFIYILGVSLFHIMRDKNVDEDIILGSICAYLLFGILWAHIFSLIEHMNPGSFKGLAQDYSHPEFATNAFRDFIYHSFVTLTTLGNGDITPVSMLARTFAVLEALVGQIYLTVIVARFIGLYIKNK